MQHHAKILRTHLEAAAICRQTEFGATSAEYIEAERLVLGLRVIPELRAGRRQ